MPNFTVNDKFDASKNYTQVKFGSDAKLLEVELNEMQKIQNEARASLVRSQIHSGVVNLASLTYGTSYPDKIRITEEMEAYLNGYRVVIPKDTDISLPAPPTFGTRDDLVFLEAWFEEYDYSKDSAILDSRIGQETSRRVKFNWRIRMVAGVNFNAYAEGINDTNTVKAWGGTGADTTHTFTKDSVDVGLYKAGDGSQTSKDVLKTTDGYVYAIPLFRVKRRNNARYHEDNLNGARDYLKPTLNRPTKLNNVGDIAQYNVVSSTDYNNLQVGDILTFDGTKNVAVQILSKDGSNNITVKNLGGVHGTTQTSLFYLLSDRPDDKYANIIDKDDIIDLRHQVSLTGFNYQKLLEENFDKLLRGELQTKDKPVMKKERLNLVPSPLGLEQELVPVTVVGNDGVARDLANILSILGNFEYDSSNVRTLYATKSLESTIYKFGTKSLKSVTSSGSSGIYIDNVPTFDYMLIGVWVRTTNGKKFRLRANVNNSSDILKETTDVISDNDFKYVYLKATKSEFRNADYFRIYLQNTDASTTYIDGLYLYRIDQGTYDKIDVDPAFTGEELAKKFPYVDSYPLNYPNFVENLVKPVDNKSFWNSAPFVGFTNAPSPEFNWGLKNIYDPIEKALKIESFTGGGHHGHSFYLPIIRDVEFTLSAKMKNVTNKMGRFYIALFESGLDKFVTSNYRPTIIANNGWEAGYYSDYTDVSITFKIPSGDHPTGRKYTVQFCGDGNSTSAIYLRDIRLEERNTKPYVPYGRHWFLPYDHRTVVSDAQTSVTRTDIVEALKTPQTHIKVTQATEGRWSTGDTIQIMSSEGVITGVLDADTALARVVKAGDNTTTIYVDDVSKLSVNDTFTLRHPDGTTSILNNIKIIAIDATNKTLTVDKTIGTDFPAGTVLIETTASTSVPTVTATGIAGTWSGLGKKTATFTITTPPTNNTDPIKIYYSISYPAGHGISEVPSEVLEASVNGQRLVKASDNIVRVKANFEGKVSGSTDLVPHKMIHRVSSTLDSPTTGGYESNQSSTNQATKLDGNLSPSYTTTSGQMAQRIFSFDLIRLMEDKFGHGFFADCVTTADKVNKLKSVITKITCNWWGYGQSPSGYKATIKQWYAATSSWANDAWTTTKSHTNSTVTKLSPTGESPSNTIDSNGFVHFLAYADPSDGTTASTIYTDYVELEVEINVAETRYDVLVPENPFPKLNENLLTANQALPIDMSSWNIYNSSTTKFEINSNGGLTFEVPGLAGNEGVYLTTSIPLDPNKYYTVLAEVKCNSGSTSQTTRMKFDPYRDDYASFGYMNFDIKAGETKTIITSGKPDTSGVFRLYIRTSGTLGAPINLTITKVMIKEGVEPNAKWTPGRKKVTILNFLRKVPGSTVENRNKLYNKFDTTFGAPSTFTNEQTQTAYDNVSKQDGTLNILTTNGAGQYAQELYEFDLSVLGMSLKELKNALRKLTVTWVGYGKGDNAGAATYGATVKWWDANTSSWYTPQSNTSSTPSIITTVDVQNKWITKDQKVYVLAHTNYPAGTSSASELYTDYIKLEVELADYVDYVKSNVVKVRKETKEVKLQYPAKSYRSGILDAVELWYKYVPYQGLVPSDVGYSVISGKMLTHLMLAVTSEGTGYPKISLVDEHYALPIYSSKSAPVSRFLPLRNPKYLYDLCCQDIRNGEQRSTTFRFLNKTKFQEYLDGNFYNNPYPTAGQIVTHFSKIEQYGKFYIHREDGIEGTYKGYIGKTDNYANFLAIGYGLFEYNGELYIGVVTTMNYGSKDIWISSHWTDALSAADFYKIEGRPLVKGV